MPGPDAAARIRQIGRLVEPREPKPPTAEGRTASFAASLYPKPRRLRPLELRARTNLIAKKPYSCAPQSRAARPAENPQEPA